jgi:hypothetical protein
MVQKREFRDRDRWLLFAFMLGPLSALSHLTVGYSLVQTACARGSKMMLHVSAASFFVLAGVAGLIAWKYYGQFAEDDGLLWKERTRWLAMVATVLAISSMIVIVAMEIPNVILRSCD